MWKIKKKFPDNRIHNLKEKMACIKHLNELTKKGVAFSVWTIDGKIYYILKSNRIVKST